jgi:AAA15 family ATPase/GTPase
LRISIYIREIKRNNIIYKYFKIIYQILFFSIDILLIDEPDAFLHPKWAKCFLNNLINIITKDEILKDRKLHLIITTHSPFILSDLPKENVIFLKDGKQEYPFTDKQTFGANIHTLLSDGFFMSDGLMGEFAKGKIEEIKKFYEKVKKSKNPIRTYLKRYNEKIKNFKHIQSIIGEPFLKTVIKNYLDELEEIFDKENYKKYFDTWFFFLIRV